MNNTILKRQAERNRDIVQNQNTQYKRNQIATAEGASSDGKTVSIANNFVGDYDATNFEPYGLASGLLSGLLVALTTINEQRSGIVGVDPNHPDRPDVNPGEVIIYCNGDQRISLLVDGTLIVEDGNHTITMGSTTFSLVSSWGTTIKFNSDNTASIIDKDGTRRL